MEYLVYDAVNSGHSKMLEILLHHGGDVNCRTSSDGFTPLHIAASRGSVDCASSVVGI